MNVGANHEQIPSTEWSQSYHLKSHQLIPTNCKVGINENVKHLDPQTWNLNPATCTKSEPVIFPRQASCTFFPAQRTTPPSPVVISLELLDSLRGLSLPVAARLLASPPPPSRRLAAVSASPDRNTVEGRAEQAVRMSLVRQGRYPHRGQGVRAGPPVRAARRRCAVGLPHQLRRMWTFGRGIGGLGGEGACELAAGRGGLGGERSDGRA